MLKQMIFPMFHFALTPPSRIIQVEKRPEDYHDRHDLHFLTTISWIFQFQHVCVKGRHSSHFSLSPHFKTAKGTPSCRTKDSVPTVSELNLGGNNWAPEPIVINGSFLVSMLDFLFFLGVTPINDLTCKWVTGFFHYTVYCISVVIAYNPLWLVRAHFVGIFYKLSKSLSSRVGHYFHRLCILQCICVCKYVRIIFKYFLTNHKRI